MRIRRRPQPPPSSLQLPASSDPTTSSTAPQTPQQNAARTRGWLEPAGSGEDREVKQMHAGADLGRKSGAARRLALPQDDDNVVVDCGRSMGAQHGDGADDGGHRRFSAVSNGHHSLDLKDSVACIGGVGGKSEPVAVKLEEPVTCNGALQLAVVPVAGATKDEEKQASSISNGSGGASGAKKRRGPAVLLEGSRCSRVNGRGWRCSQPTLVGYSLCEHHLGKGRMRSAAAAAAARGRLGRTEHAATRTIPAAAVGVVAGIPAVAMPPKAEAPSLPPC
ncbi:unnamed protein product [Urochloa humidicola]